MFAYFSTSHPSIHLFIRSLFFLRLYTWLGWIACGCHLFAWQTKNLVLSLLYFMQYNVPIEYVECICLLLMQLWYSYIFFLFEIGVNWLWIFQKKNRDQSIHFKNSQWIEWKPRNVFAKYYHASIIARKVISNLIRWNRIEWRLEIGDETRSHLQKFTEPTLNTLYTEWTFLHVSFIYFFFSSKNGSRYCQWRAFHRVIHQYIVVDWEPVDCFIFIYYEWMTNWVLCLEISCYFFSILFSSSSSFSLSLLSSAFKDFP